MQEKNFNITGVEVEIIENPNEDIRFHPEIEMIYILEGQVAVSIQDHTYQYEKDGMVLVNSMMPFTIQGDHAVIALFHISYQVLSQLMKDECFTFVCNTALDNVRPYNRLREILDQIIYNSLENQHKTNCMKYSLDYQLLDCLIEEFQIHYGKNRKEIRMDTSERLQMILNYVNMNYQHQISLNELADRMFLSTSSLSRSFRKETGIYFAEFVTNVRLYYAVRELIYTSEPITKVAVDNGFSNPSVFGKLFHDRYHMSPSNYRKQMKADEQTASAEKSAMKEKLISQMQNRTQQTLRQEVKKQQKVVSNVEKAQRYEPFWNKVINIGSAYNLTRANLQYHTLFLIENLHFTHVRLWNIFSERMQIRKDTNDKMFNFDNLDTILDFLMKHDIKPYLDFGIRPECAIKTGREMVYFEQDHMDIQSIEEWGRLVESFIRHIIKRFGSDEVNRWIFEYSLDSNQQMNISQNSIEDFFMKYRKWFELVRSAIPDATMAGPNISLESNETLFYEFLHQCSQYECMPDYITVMLFPYQSVSDEDGYQYTQRISDFGLMEAQLQNVKRIMRECDASHVKLSVSEWSSSLSNRNFLNDSSFRAAYTMKMIGMMWNKVDMACFWMGSDWISAYYDSGRVIQGGVGLISKDGIRIPVFYAVEFLNDLGKFFIECGENYIVTSNGGNSYYIACFNFKWYSCNYFIKGEHELDIKSLDTFFEDNDPVKIHFQLKNIQGKKKYTVKKHLLNDEYGNVLQEWIRFNCEEELEGSDVKYLREICIPHLSMQKIMATEDGLEFETELAAHEIALLHIYQDF